MNLGTINWVIHFPKLIAKKHCFNPCLSHFITTECIHYTFVNSKEMYTPWDFCPAPSAVSTWINTVIQLCRSSNT